MRRISPLAARRLALHAQLLDGRAGLPRDLEGSAAVIERLGYVQIDTINVIERAHHHTLWTRHPVHEPAMLDRLLAERRVFEYWGHAASYLPMADYRFYLPRMRGFLRPKRRYTREAVEKSRPLLKPVLRRIRREGPLTAQAFETDRPRRGGWWSWKDSKLALEVLLWQGELMVAARNRFQRVYDLTERVLPPGTDTRLPSDEEVGRFLVRRALAAYGLATAREICEHIRHDREAVAPALQALLEEGEVVPVRIRGREEEDYALAGALQRATRLRRRRPRMHLLSPFDNLIIQLESTSRLFGFDYRLECYTPAAKRKHGYFVLPVLWSEALVARLDAKAERKQRTLALRRLSLEPGFTEVDPFLPALADKLRDLAAFNGCEAVRVEEVSPARLKAPLRRLLR